MRVFLVGATGAVGARLVPMLVAAGHEVTGTTTSAAKAGGVRAAGAEPVVLDVLDPDAVREAVRAAAPEAIVHEATGLAGAIDLRHFDRSFARTNELRTRGTDHLLAAARDTGVRTFVAQSYAGWNLRRNLDGRDASLATEAEPLDREPLASTRATMAAIRHLEDAVTGTAGIEGTVLRYGSLYGPGTDLAAGSTWETMVRKRQFPVVGRGGGVFSFLHVDDAAGAVLAALDAAAPGTYHVVDDEPAPTRVWLPYLAETLGARPPFRLPALLARPLLGEQGVSMMTVQRGASNALARERLGWRPRWSTWRDGFRDGLG